MLFLAFLGALVAVECQTRRDQRDRHHEGQKQEGRGDRTPTGPLDPAFPGAGPAGLDRLTAQVSAQVVGESLC